MRDLLYFVIGILLGLICIFFDGSAVMAKSTSTATGIPRFGRLRPRIRRPPRWAVETPIDPASAGMCSMNQGGTHRGQDRKISVQEHRRLDVDKSGCPARLERHGKAAVAHATAAERRRGKDSIIQTPIGQVDLGLPITA
jgi:hypothetical protein